MNRVKSLFTSSFILGIVAVLLDAFLLEHIFFAVKKYKIGSINKRADFIKILHLTDLHFRNTLSIKYRKLAKRINKISPDIIFISGDSIDQEGKPEPLEQFLRLLDSHIPKVAIPGNHEYASGIDIDNLKELFDKVNGSLLINDSKAYSIRGTRIIVTGLDDILEGDEDFARAVEGVGKEKHHFVLIHSPKHQEKVKDDIKRLNKVRVEEDELNIFGFFAGHNHGGQIKIGNYAPYLPPKAGDYLEGWYNKEKPYLYLSRGFGTSTVPIRFWSRSEITLFIYYVD
jgi:predicted MPP superfamily phosphohydrolase